MANLIFYSKDPNIEPIIVPWASDHDICVDEMGIKCYASNIYEHLCNEPYFYFRREIIQINSVHIENFKKLLLYHEYYSYKYALHMQCRWPEAEKIILKHPQIAVDYARYVIRDRWPELEEVLLKDHDSTLVWTIDDITMRYILYVIKGPWPEAEKVMSAHHKGIYHMWMKIMETNKCPKSS